MHRHWYLFCTDIHMYALKGKQAWYWTVSGGHPWFGASGMLCSYLDGGQDVHFPLGRAHLVSAGKPWGALRPSAWPCSKCSSCSSRATLGTLLSSLASYKAQHPVSRSLQPQWLALTSAGRGGPPGGQEAPAPAGGHRCPRQRRPRRALPTSLLTARLVAEPALCGRKLWFHIMSVFISGSWKCRGCCLWDMQMVKQMLAGSSAG